MRTVPARRDEGEKVPHTLRACFPSVLTKLVRDSSPRRIRSRAPTEYILPSFLPRRWPYCRTKIGRGICRFGRSPGQRKGNERMGAPSISRRPPAFPESVHAQHPTNYRTIGSSAELILMGLGASRVGRRVGAADDAVGQDVCNYAASREHGCLTCIEHSGLGVPQPAITFPQCPVEGTPSSARARSRATCINFVSKARNSVFSSFR